MIQVGFSTHKWNPISALIRLITRSPISHCWILYHDAQFKIDMIMESSFEGFRITPYAIFQKKNDGIQLFTPKYDLDTGLIQAGNKLGETYDVDGLLGMLIPLLGRWFKKKWHNPFRSSTEMFCSQAIVEVMQASNYPGSEQLIAADTSPDDLYNFFKNEK